MRRLSRRQFVAGVGSAGLLAGCGRLPWQTQQPAKVPRIGFLVGTPLLPQHEGFRQGLRDLGYVEGENIIVEYRSGEGRPEQLPTLAAELARLPVDILVTGGSPSARAARDATSTIPVVMFLPDDPVASGLVASLGRPGGNLTGVTTMAPQLAGKKLELLKTTVPKLAQVAVLRDPSLPQNLLESEEIEAAGQLLAVQVQLIDVRALGDVESALDAAITKRVDGLVILQNSFTISKMPWIVDQATRSGLPAIYQSGDVVVSGGLMSYGPRSSELYRRMATYVDKILKGTKPADLPVEQPMRFDFVVNMRTARALGITFPHEVALQITEVVE